jgi:hypothetical protein
MRKKVFIKNYIYSKHNPKISIIIISSMDFFGSLNKLAQTGFDGRGPHKFQNDCGEIWCVQCGLKRA